MPLLVLETNLLPADADRETLLKRLSSVTAEALGKPERYVMVTLRHNPDMLFSGDNTPLAYLELKSIGLPEQRTTELSATLCATVAESLGIANDRIYIEFADAARHLWGWNGGTF